MNKVREAVDAKRRWMNSKMQEQAQLATHQDPATRCSEIRANKQVEGDLHVMEDLLCVCSVPCSDFLVNKVYDYSVCVCVCVEPVGDFRCIKREREV